MAVAELTPNDATTISLQCDPREVELAKMIPGSRWVNQEWQIPTSWAAVQTYFGVFGHHAHFGPNLAYWYEQQLAWANQQIMYRLAPDVDVHGPTWDRLKPLQRTGVCFMALAGSSVNTDEMGGGKTVMMIAALKLRMALDQAEEPFEAQAGEQWKGLPIFIVAPKKVKRSWATHFAEWFPDLRVVVAGDKLKDKRDAIAAVKEERADVLIGNWDMLPTMSRLEAFGNISLTENERKPKELNEIQWGTVIADEAHRMIDRKGKWARALKAVAFGTPSIGTHMCAYRHALTGTPVENNSADLWSILNFTHPTWFPAYSKYVERFATTTWNRWGALEIGGLNPITRAEHDAIVLPIFLRRPRELLLPDLQVLPPTIHWVEMAPKQKKAYKQMAEQMLAELDNGVLAATSPMHRSNRLTQLAQAYGELVDKGRTTEDGEKILDLQLAAPSCKVDALLDLIEEAGSSRWGGTQIVVGMESRQLEALCERALTKHKISFSRFVGGMTEQESANEEDRFQRGETRIALCTISAAAEGLNGLSVASTMVFLQRSWRALLNDQFMGRVLRPGQTRPVQIIDVMSEFTVEQWKAEKLAGKEVTFQDIVQDEALLREMLAYVG